MTMWFYMLDPDGNRVTDPDGNYILLPFVTGGHGLRYGDGWHGWGVL